MIAAGASHENRQQMLETMLEDDRYRDIVLIPTEYEGEPAIQLQDYKTKEIVGWIPKDMVEEYLNVKKLIGRINYHPSRNYYNMSFYAPQRPSHKEYHYMKALCAKYNLSMPFYDRRAYAERFAQLQGMNEQ